MRPVLARLAAGMGMMAMLAGCAAPPRAGTIPMNTIYDNAVPGQRSAVLLIMLPGVKNTPEEFAQRGFVQALRQRGLAVDVAAVDAHLGYYLDRSVVERLRQDVVSPARLQGYRRIWLLGISLGGLGSTLYLREHPDEIEGVVLLAPFLGVQGTLAEIQRAGGLAGWHPEIQPGDDERMLLAWLRDHDFSAPGSPPVYLGYGLSDRYAPGSELLAARLPAQHVVAIDGNHRWPTWSRLWDEFLDRRIIPDATIHP